MRAHAQCELKEYTRNGKRGLLSSGVRTPSTFHSYGKHPLCLALKASGLLTAKFFFLCFQNAARRNSIVKWW